MKRERIAIVGTGISGLVCADGLHSAHEVTVFEAGDSVGGHTRTRRVEHEGRTIPVDTGFIVFNTRNYPNFTTLMDRLGVLSQPTTMSFSVRDDRVGFEYGGASLDSMLSQRRNVVRPRFWSMVRGFRRFAARAPEVVACGGAEHLTLGAYLERERYPSAFVEHLIVPMAAAIWSSPDQEIFDYPLEFFVRFFHNHGMLSIRERPVWRTITGGSQTYVDRLIQPFKDRIRVRTPVHRIRRGVDGVTLSVGGEGGGRGGREEARFDRVILACHADQALGMLEDATAQEREVLGAIPYRANAAALHRDESLLPRSRRAWSAWNYRAWPERNDRVAVTYDMTILQRLETKRHLSVTLNQIGEIDPSLILDRHTFEHPAFSSRAIAAQKRHAEISGVNRTHYCGAYWFNGFHEDGVRSGLRVVDAIRGTADSSLPVSKDAAHDAKMPPMLVGMEGR
jgi:predicted NAD/FAD-binding protein